jgi:hypothetical protein
LASPHDSLVPSNLSDQSKVNLSAGHDRRIVLALQGDDDMSAGLVGSAIP